MEQIALMRNLLEDMQPEVTADPESFKPNFTLDGTVRSNADVDEYAPFEDELKAFEEQHGRSGQVPAGKSRVPTRPRPFR